MLGSVSDPGGEGMSLLQWRGPRRALAGLATGPAMQGSWGPLVSISFSRGIFLTQGLNPGLLQLLRSVRLFVTP